MDQHQQTLGFLLLLQENPTLMPPVAGDVSLVSVNYRADSRLMCLCCGGVAEVAVVAYTDTAAHADTVKRWLDLCAQCFWSVRAVTEHETWE